MKRVTLFTIMLCGVMLIWCSGFLPDIRDPQSPPNTHVSAYYIEHAEADTATPNLVAAVLADYRGYDTMFETAVIFAAGLAVFILLWGLKGGISADSLHGHRNTGRGVRAGEDQPGENDEPQRTGSPWMPKDLIIQTTCRIMSPLMMVFALYILVMGHYGPGGGFQAGVILGAAFILIGIAYNINEVMKLLPARRVFILGALGVLIYVGTGLLALLCGGNFLDYGVLGWLFGTESPKTRAEGILLVETGVTMAVSMVMVGLYYSIASLGNVEEGL